MLKSRRLILVFLFAAVIFIFSLECVTAKKHRSLKIKKRLKLQHQPRPPPTSVTARRNDTNTTTESPSFVIDHSPECNCFRKDGRPYRYIAGNMHYFQVPHGYWRDRMLKMRAAGLNVLQTYVAWNMHEPFEGAYDFEEQNNVFEYLELAKNMSMDVVLRIGPYINAERDFGGLPFWLYNINPNMQPRTSDPTYQAAVKRWWDKLLPLLVPHLYINGGNVLMVQIENEYAFHTVCDKAHLKWLLDLAVSHLGSKVTYYTTDAGFSPDFLRCGRIEGAHSTTDFDVNTPASLPFANLRKVQPSGPLINSEFYPGWVTTWNDNYVKISSDLFVMRMKEILEYDASSSLTIYPFHGGTNFGFQAGGHYFNTQPQLYNAFVASYDFNAPISESGDITPKYYAVREVIQKYLPSSQKNYEIPSNIPRKAFGTVKLEKCGNLFKNLEKFTTFSDFAMIAADGTPPTFEQALLNYGYALYEHVVTRHDLLNRKSQSKGVAELHGAGVHDFAIVFLNGKRIGEICRLCRKYNLSLGASNSIKAGQTLSILVENQGRSAFGDINDQKGLNIGAPISLSFDGRAPKQLFNWTMVPIPINGTIWTNPTKIVSTDKKSTKPESFLPSRYQGTFKTPVDSTLGHPADTFLRFRPSPTSSPSMQLGWQKGVVLVNGHNLGRYWLERSSQQTLYVPGVWLRPAPQQNYLTIFETHFSPCECVATKDVACKCEVYLVDTPIIDEPISKRIEDEKDSKATVDALSGQWFDKQHKKLWWDAAAPKNRSNNATFSSSFAAVSSAPPLLLTSRLQPTEDITKEEKRIAKQQRSKQKKKERKDNNRKNRTLRSRSQVWTIEAR